MLGTPFKIVNFLRNADNYTPAHYSIKVFIQEMLKIEKKYLVDLFYSVVE